MVHLGKTYSNLVVDLDATNAKLRERLNADDERLGTRVTDDVTAAFAAEARLPAVARRRQRRAWPPGAKQPVAGDSSARSNSARARTAEGHRFESSPAPDSLSSVRGLRASVGLTLRLPGRDRPAPGTRRASEARGRPGGARRGRADADVRARTRPCGRPPGGWPGGFPVRCRGGRGRRRRAMNSSAPATLPVS
jgi:hypothetical protein